MKVRSGFVSNSSSSSFVVSFPRVPTSIEDVRSMMFDKEKTIPYYGNYTKKGFETIEHDIMEIAKVIYEDIAGEEGNEFHLPQKPNDVLTIASRIESYGCDFEEEEEQKEIVKEFANSLIVDSLVSSENRDRLEEILILFGRCYSKTSVWEAREHIKNLGGFVYSFHFSDEDGNFWGMMEHANIFRNLPHVCISHH